MAKKLTTHRPPKAKKARKAKLATKQAKAARPSPPAASQRRPKKQRMYRMGSQAWFKRLQQLGLPTPAPMQLKGKPPGNPLKANTPADRRVQKLQKLWYAKAAASGFVDIEWIDHETGYGQDSKHLKGSWLDLDKMEYGLEFSRMTGVYANHATFDVKWDAEIWQLFANGEPYRDILQKLRAKGMRRSLYYVWARIDHHLQLLKPWHETHPEGLYANYEEPYIADVLLREPD